MTDPRETARMTSLIATCEACAAPIAGGTGYVWVDIDAARRVGEAVSEWETRHSGSAMTVTDLLTHPDATPWRAHHQACDPEPDNWLAYWISVERLANTTALLWWTAHLEGKNWIRHTDWFALVQAVTSGGDKRLRIVQERAA